MGHLAPTDALSYLPKNHIFSSSAWISFHACVCHKSSERKMFSPFHENVQILRWGKFFFFHIPQKYLFFISLILEWMMSLFFIDLKMQKMLNIWCEDFSLINTFCSRFRTLPFGSSIKSVSNGTSWYPTIRTSSSAAAETSRTTAVT